MKTLTEGKKNVSIKMSGRIFIFIVTLLQDISLSGSTWQLREIFSARASNNFNWQHKKLTLQISPETFLSPFYSGLLRIDEAFSWSTKYQDRKVDQDIPEDSWSQVPADLSSLVGPSPVLASSAHREVNWSQHLKLPPKLSHQAQPPVFTRVSGRHLGMFWRG